MPKITRLHRPVIAKMAATDLVYHIHDAQNRDNQIDQGLTLSTIAVIQGFNTRDVESPQTIPDSAGLNFRPVTVRSDTVSLTLALRDETLLELERGVRTSDREWKEAISHTRHDWVGNLGTSSTDMPLSQLGIASTQTPDYISPDGRVVIELATCAVDFDRVLDRSYKKKIMAYWHHLKPRNIIYGIIVVGPRKIMTNCVLQPHMVSELCRDVAKAWHLKQH